MPLQLHTPLDWTLAVLASYGVLSVLGLVARLIGRSVLGTARNTIGAVIFVQNQEDEIEGFLRSLTTLRRIPHEGILVVDLASTDDTGHILDRLAKENDAIRVLHLPAHAPAPYETALFLCRSQTTMVVEMRGDVDTRAILQTLRTIW